MCARVPHRENINRMVKRVREEIESTKNTDAGSQFATKADAIKHKLYGAVAAWRGGGW